MRVLISDNFSPEGLQIISEARGLELDYRPGISPEELQQIIPDYEALLVRGGTAVTEQLLKTASRLKIISRAGIGVENIDMQAANSRGIVVTNTPLGSTTTIAEHAIAMMLSLARMIPKLTNRCAKGPGIPPASWARKSAARPSASSAVAKSAGGSSNMPAACT